MSDQAEQPQPNTRTAQEVRALLDAHGIRFRDCVDAFGATRKDNPYVLTAQSLHHNEGEVEIEDTTVLSEADEGVWVMAWIWVSKNDAENYPERLEELMPAARAARDLTEEQSVHLDWIEDLYTNLADDMDRIISADLPEITNPTPIAWIDQNNVEWSFLPSAAFGTMVAAATRAFAPVEQVEAIEQFARMFGPRLDCLAGLAAMQANAA